ncbi:MAG: AAA family ATPase [Bacilli bacterium]|nr:AAA family ATPase [Bacilli bacterium]
MLIVVTGLDGSGTSSVAKKLHEMDPGSYLLKTPSPEYADRKRMDEALHDESPVAHMLYYLSSDIYISDYIKNHCDYKNHNVYLVRYLIDTVVSSRARGIDVDLDYNLYGNQLLVPDLTIFVRLDEETRQRRLQERGKDCLDVVLDDFENREKFLGEFSQLLDPKRTIYVTNNKALEEVCSETFQKIKTDKSHL